MAGVNLQAHLGIMCTVVARRVSSSGVSNSNEMTNHIDKERAHTQQEYNSGQYLVLSRECIDPQRRECLHVKYSVSELGFI